MFTLNNFLSFIFQVHTKLTVQTVAIKIRQQTKNLNVEKYERVKYIYYFSEAMCDITLNI